MKHVMKTILLLVLLAFTAPALAESGAPGGGAPGTSSAPGTAAPGTTSAPGTGSGISTAGPGSSSTAPGTATIGQVYQ